MSTPVGLKRTLRGLSAAVFLFAMTTSCLGADFGLSATIRAGLFNAGDWELGIGPSGNNTLRNRSLQQYYPNGDFRAFQLGYTNSTNTAYLRYYHSPSVFEQVTYSQTGPGLGGGSVWTIPVDSLFVSATTKFWPTSITVDQLMLGGGVQVLQPFSATTLTAQGWGQTKTGTTTPVVFRTSVTGDWLLSGRVGFSGLSAYVPLLGAQRSQLQMIANVSGTSVATPEPPAAGLFAVGLIVIGLRARRKPIGKGAR